MSTIFISFIRATIKRPNRVFLKPFGLGSFPPSLRKFTSEKSGGKNGEKAINWLNWALLSAATPAIALLYNYWDLVDNQLLRYEWFTSRKIIDKKFEVTSDIPKVERKALDSLLSPLVGTKSGQYYILVGPRGCGKTTAIGQACVGKEGVARIRVDKNNVNVFELVAEKFGVKSPYYNFNAQDDLVKLFKQASARKGGNWVPTIIAEIDRGAETGTIENVAKSLKVICFLTKDPGIRRKSCASCNRFERCKRCIFFTEG
jgi:hypothetical protein